MFQMNQQHVWVDEQMKQKRNYNCKYFKAILLCLEFGNFSNLILKLIEVSY